MDSISDKTKKYLAMMEDKFNKENFSEFIKDLLNLENEDIENGKEESETSEQYKKYIDKFQLFAKYQDNRREVIGVIIIKLKDNKTPANARTLQRNYIAHLLGYYELDASITAIYSDTDDTWRLSFVKKELQIEVGKRGTKIGQKISPAKRYSYLFGKDEPNHTAKEQLVDFIEKNDKKYTIEELEEKFSVEKVTKDFFERYKENYLKLKEILEQNEEFVSEAKRCDFTSEEFTKKLMGQIVFIYFLQKKGWLGVNLVPKKLLINEYNEIYNKQDLIGKKVLDKYYTESNGEKIVDEDLLEKLKGNEQEIETLSDIFVDTKYDKEWGTGEKRFIRKRFEDCKNKNKKFFDDYLEPLFYNGLNHKRKNQYFSVFNCKIPFLNGGLFEPLDNYKWEIAKFGIENKIFSNDEENGILDFFDRYNFTMNEEEPLEKDVAVDPEMLGKIFENLLDVKDRKSKGAFYTPREIVHYMCQESLANYLVNKLGVDYNEIKEFIQYGEMIRDVDLQEATNEDYLVGKTIFENIIKIDKALAKIKIADPAVGSGAFPLGILNEIVKLRDILTSYLLIYNRLNLLNKKYSEELIINKRSIYKIKWNTIRNSIYAVDIENSAVDITKLRLWLSIVVDQVEVPKTGPEPLPNLDCKIMQGNSLIDEYAGIKLINERFIDELKDRENVKFNDGGRVKERGRFVSISEDQIQLGDGQKKSVIDKLIKEKIEYFGTNDGKRKEEIKLKIKDLRKELLKLNFVEIGKINELLKIDESHNKPYFAWMLEFIEVFIENNGFDIIIGNPPYVGEKGNKETFGYIANTEFGKKYKQGKMDLFYYFFHKGIDLLNEIGELKFITTNYFITATGASKLRMDLKERTNIRRLINFNEYKIFKSAMGQHNMITELSKNKLSNAEIIQVKMKGDISDGRISDILYKNKDNSFVEIYKMYYDELFDGEENYIRVTKNEFMEIFKKMQDKSKKLGELCYIHQGLKSNSDKVTEVHLNKYNLGSEVKKGDGIFVLTKKELERLDLNEDESNFAKPLFKNSDINRYITNNKTEEFVLYITKDNYIDEEKGKLKKHFEIYLPILKNRAEVEPNGTIKTYALTRPREQFMYESPKIVAPYKSRGNIFGYNECSWYGSGDIYYINGKNNDKKLLKYILALLNSKLYYVWFYFNGKRKGYLFELYQKPLSETPIKIADKEIFDKVVKRVDDILKKDNVKENEDVINTLIYNIYNLNLKEIELIEKIYEDGNIKGIDEIG